MLLNLRALSNANMTEYEMGKTLTLHFAPDGRPQHDTSGLATADFTMTEIPREERVEDGGPKPSMDQEPKYT